MPMQLDASHRLFQAPRVVGSRPETSSQPSRYVRRALVVGSLVKYAQLLFLRVDKMRQEYAVAYPEAL